MRLGRVCGLAAVIFEQPAHFSVEFLVGKAFLSAFRTDLSVTTLFSMRYASM